MPAVTEPGLLPEYRRASAAFDASTYRRILHAPGKKLGAEVLKRLHHRLGLTRQLESGVFWGEKMKIVLPEALSESVHRFGVYEPGLTRFLLDELGPGMIFFDIGAHFGYFSLLAATLVGHAGEVHSFEPVPGTFAVLAANLGGRANVVLNQQAVWSEAAALDITDHGLELSGHNSAFSPRMGAQRPSGPRLNGPTVHRVQATTVDDYARSAGCAPSFVKIDAESAESRIIDGMMETIAAHYPVISVEVGDFDVPGAPSSRELLDKIIGAGYRPFELRNGAVTPHGLRRHYEYDNILLRPREAAER